MIVWYIRFRGGVFSGRHTIPLTLLSLIVLVTPTAFDFSNGLEASVTELVCELLRTVRCVEIISGVGRCSYCFRASIRNWQDITIATVLRRGYNIHDGMMQ